MRANGTRGQYHPVVLRGAGVAASLGADRLGDCPAVSGAVAACGANVLVAWGRLCRSQPGRRQAAARRAAAGKEEARNAEMDSPAPQGSVQCKGLAWSIRVCFVGDGATRATASLS